MKKRADELAVRYPTNAQIRLMKKSIDAHLDYVYVPYVKKILDLLTIDRWVRIVAIITLIVNGLHLIMAYLVSMHKDNGAESWTQTIVRNVNIAAITFLILTTIGQLIVLIKTC